MESVFPLFPGLTGPLCFPPCSAPIQYLPETSFPNQVNSQPFPLTREDNPCSQLTTALITPSPHSPVTVNISGSHGVPEIGGHLLREVTGRGEVRNVGVDSLQFPKAIHTFPSKPLCHTIYKAPYSKSVLIQKYIFIYYKYLFNIFLSYLLRVLLEANAD